MGGAGARHIIKLTLALLSAASLACTALTAAAYAHDTHGPDPRAVDGPATASLAATRPWCGSRSRPDPPGVRAAPFRYHAVYLVPKDGRSRLHAVAPALQGGAFGASRLLERLYGRAIRFDMGTRCGRGFLDISELRLSATRAALRQAARAADETALFDLVRREMRRAGFWLSGDRPTYAWPPRNTVNYLAWLDGPRPRRSCGQATSLLDRRRAYWNANNAGGKLALVFRKGRGFCGPDTIRHEVGHNLGALQPQARNTRDGAHCTDALEDTMCVDTAPRVARRGRAHDAYFDYANDDYWDPPRGRPLGWWTVNLSWFICPDARCNRP